MYRLLGFDFGTQKIGLATGQTLTGTAQALGNIAVRNGAVDWPSIDHEIKQWQPNKLIVGLPLKMDGSEQWTTVAARDFADALRERYPQPVELFDERLTTVAARDLIFSEGGYRALQKSAIDAVAAKLMLEVYMSQHDAGDNLK